MDLRTQLRFDADPVTVFDMLVDETYLGRKVAAANAIRHEASVLRNHDRVTVRLLRVMPPDVPDYIRRFVGDTINLDQTDVWGPAAPDGSRSGSIRVQLVGHPVVFTGAMSLRPDGRGSVSTVEGKIKASIPFVAGKIERAVHGALVEAARIEEQVARDWLARRN